MKPIIAGLLILTLTNCNSEKPIVGKIVGGAWITRGTGSSDLLRGLHVQLCKAMVDSISRRDYPSVQGGLLIIAAIVMIVNLIVDLMYGLINPRIRHR